MRSVLPIFANGPDFINWRRCILLTDITSQTVEKSYLIVFPHRIGKEFSKPLTKNREVGRFLYRLSPKKVHHLKIKITREIFNLELKLTFFLKSAGEKYFERKLPCLNGRVTKHRTQNQVQLFSVM